MTSDTPDTEDRLGIPACHEPGIGQISYLMDPFFAERDADIRNIASKNLRINRYRILDIVLIGSNDSRKSQHEVFVRTACERDSRGLFFMMTTAVLMVRMADVHIETHDTHQVP